MRMPVKVSDNIGVRIQDLQILSQEQEEGAHVSVTWHAKSEHTFKMYSYGRALRAWC